MSYTALYRKFRPGEFDEVKGQDHIVTALRNQVRADRIGHASVSYTHLDVYKRQEEEMVGHNAIAAGFQGQRQWTDFYPNGDYAEALLNSSFDWNGAREPYVLATDVYKRQIL